MTIWQCCHTSQNLVYLYRMTHATISDQQFYIKINKNLPFQVTKSVYQAVLPNVGVICKRRLQQKTPFILKLKTTFFGNTALDEILHSKIKKQKRMQVLFKKNKNKSLHQPVLTYLVLTLSDVIQMVLTFDRCNKLPLLPVYLPLLPLSLTRLPNLFYSKSFRGKPNFCLNTTSRLAPKKFFNLNVFVVYFSNYLFAKKSQPLLLLTQISLARKVKVTGSIPPPPGFLHPNPAKTWQKNVAPIVQSPQL